MLRRGKEPNALACSGRSPLQMGVWPDSTFSADTLAFILRFLASPNSSRQGPRRMTSPSAAPISDTAYGHRARIGYTSPPLTTEGFPYEFYQMAPAGVTLVITTLAIVVRSKEEVDQSYDTSMKAAREMAAAGVDIIVLGGVPIHLSRGPVNAQQMIRDLEAELKVKVSTSASAQARAAKALGCKKVVVAQPYAHSDTDRIASYALHFGCEVLGATGWGSALEQIGRQARHAAID